MPQEIAVRKFSPNTLAERLEFARYLAKAGMLQKQYREQPGNILLAMEYGDSLGIPTVQAMSTIHVIDGKPSASAALISALVRRAGHRLRITGDDRHAVATIHRSDDPDYEYKAEWTVDRAVRAGLCTLTDGVPRSRSQRGDKLPWETYTAAMLKARAITEVARDACQEALMGIQYTAEELGANVDADGNPTGGLAEPVEEHRQVKPDETPPPAAAEPEVEDAVIVPPEVIDETWYDRLENLATQGELDLVDQMGAQANAAGDENALEQYRVFRREHALPIWIENNPDEHARRQAAAAARREQVGS